MVTASPRRETMKTLIHQVLIFKSTNFGNVASWSSWIRRNVGTHCSHQKRRGPGGNSKRTSELTLIRSRDVEPPARPFVDAGQLGEREGAAMLPACENGPTITGKSQ